LLALVLVFGTAHAESIPLVREHGTFVIPVVINDRITLNFTVDSGASDVSIPADVFSTLIRTGTVLSADFLDTQVYELADGTKRRSQRFRIRSLKIGGQEVRDVTASVAPEAGALLLGQSFLSRLKSWSIDSARQLLVVNELPTRSRASSISVGPHTPPRGTVSDNAVQGAQWVSLGSFNGGKLEDFVDVSSIRIDGDVRRAWIRGVFVPHTVHGFDKNADQWVNVLIWHGEFNCVDETYREEMHHAVYDDGTYWFPSDEIKALTKSITEEWLQVTPDIDVPRAQWRFVCAWKPK